MPDFAPFASIIGVIIGFLLGVVKDLIFGRPKLTISYGHPTSSFNYFVKSTNNMRETEIIKEYSHESYLLKLEFTLNFYNTGKAATAIKEVTVLLNNTKAGCHRNLTPKCDEHSFNVGAGCIVSQKYSLSIDKNEDNVCFFEDIIFDTDSKERLRITIKVKDIYNKVHEIDFEPYAFWTA